MRKRELYWIVGMIVIILSLFTLIFGIEGFNGDSTLDINIHDTYFVIANSHFIILLGIFVFFTVYLIRAILCNFKNLTINLILIISTIFVLLILSGVESLVDLFLGQNSNWTVYPPLSTSQKDYLLESKESKPGALSTLFFIVQISLLILLAFCAFKSGIHFKRAE